MAGLLRDIPDIARRAGLGPSIRQEQVAKIQRNWVDSRVNRARRQIGAPPPSDIPFQQRGPGPVIPMGPFDPPGGSPVNYVWPGSTTWGGTNPLQPGTFPAPIPLNPSAGTDPYGSLTNTACSFISDARLRALCIAAGGLLGGGGGGGGGGGFQPVTPCPTGYKRRADGSCQVEGAGGYLPGDIGMQDFGWGTVNGRYGAGYVPIVVQRNYSACPPGSKLGKDGVCYDRIARTNRKHNPGARPFMTGGEVSTVRRAAAIQKRGAKLLRKLMPARRPCAPKGKRKR